MYKKIFFICFCCIFSNIVFGKKDNIQIDGKIEYSDIVEVGAVNIRKAESGTYMADIYAHNNQIMAGVQFELLGKDFKILKVEGGRVGDGNFITHVGSDKGVILAFSMTGKMISAIDTLDYSKNKLFTLHFKKNIDKPSEFKMKALLAGKTGTKLSANFIPFLVD
ncbi:MAG: hypothetical protein CMG00_08505 [Candidatus Marinimicrobia bacterium]|nr:hypothetical protein [Candidatus Neomarinimicrobiota bacterium]|tara:strand:+ start:28352 stop:28846 length:495 start_codon:yes stop_codon:yes gene_type:complete